MTLDVIVDIICGIVQAHVESNIHVPIHSATASDGINDDPYTNSFVRRPGHCVGRY